MYYVYALTDPRKGDQPFYIGKGSGSRAISHMYESYETTGNRRKWTTIQAISNAGLTVGVSYLQENLSEQEAYDLEAHLIKQYGRKDLDEGGTLTNICIDNRPPNPAGRVVSEETRRKHSERQKGPLNHKFGKTCSEDDKAKKRAANLALGITPPNHTGRKRSEETKRKQSLAAKGKAKSIEHREAISLTRKGKNIGPRSDAAKAKMSAWQQRAYDFTNPEGKTHTVMSANLSKFCEVHSMTYGGMMAAVKAGRLYKGWSITRR